MSQSVLQLSDSRLKLGNDALETVDGLVVDRSHGEWNNAYFGLIERELKIKKQRREREKEGKEEVLWGEWREERCQWQVGRDCQKFQFGETWMWKFSISRKTEADKRAISEHIHTLTPTKQPAKSQRVHYTIWISTHESTIIGGGIVCMQNFCIILYTGGWGTRTLRRIDLEEQKSVHVHVHI